MSRLLRTLALASSCLCLVLHAAPPATSSAPAVVPGVLTNPDPTKPPPFVDVPGQKHDNGSVDRATEAIPAAILAKVQAAHDAWRAANGSNLYPKLRYAGGYPTLMLVQPADETAGKRLQRLRAILGACEYLVADDTFDHAIVCITTFDRKNPQATTTRNITIKRTDFQGAVTKVGKAPLFSAALVAAKRSDAAMQEVCTQLGIN